MEEQKTQAVEDRDQAQKEQLEAQARGDIGAELRGFAREVVDDHLQFPGDIAADANDPERRVSEEQGTARHPESEPGPDAPQADRTNPVVEHP